MNEPRHLVFAVKFLSHDGKSDLIIFNTRAQATEAKNRINGATLSLHMVGDNDGRVKLSPAQKKFLAGFARTGYSLAPGGFHNAAVQASAWHRTCDSLVAMGLVKRSGHQAAHLTWLGLAWTVSILRGDA